MTPEEKGREFLRFVAVHEARLRHNLKKNITYDGRIFDDVFSETVLRVHDSIVSRDLDIKDLEKYFYTASRYQYIIEDNRRREHDVIHVDIGEVAGHADERETVTLPTIEEVKRRLSELFGESDASLFVDYMGCKVMGRASYREYSRLNAMSLGKVKEVVGRIKKHIRIHGLCKKERETEGDTATHERPQGA